MGSLYKNQSCLIFIIILSITFLFQSLLLYLPIVSANDVLTPGDQINTLDDGSSSTLSSSNGKFTLGFFTITPSGMVKTYLGIWYTNEQLIKRIWIANRDLPIHGDAILTIDDVSGTLRVINRSGATLLNVSSNDKVGSRNNNRRAVLQDSGNFVFYDEANRTIWQSFDHPTDTLIPGMKLGYNLTVKKNWELTSAVNTDVPDSGAFTMRLELYQNIPQLLIYRRGVIYWASGPWNKRAGNFQLLPFVYMDSKFDLISVPSGMYVIVLQTNGSSTPTLVLSPDGKFQDENKYGVPNFCYGYERYDGCADYPVPNCRALASNQSEINEYQWTIQDYFFSSPIKTVNKTVDNSSLGDCMERCWNDCDCVACSSYNNTGCIYWTQQNPQLPIQVYTLADQLQPPLQVYTFGNILIPNSTSTSTSTTSTSKKISRWLLLCLAVVPVLVLIYVVIKRCIIKGKKNRMRDDLIHQLTSSNSFNYGDEVERGIQGTPDIKIFSLKAILVAINNFSEENKLGQGGYGPVYKGVLSDGRKIAVKRLLNTSGQGVLEFRSELVLISKLQHANLVRLYGCCIHLEEKMLIYEFMPNKSLDFFLFDNDKKRNIDWQIRFKIIEGIAQGLLYLHKYSRMKVIHRDLKVSNVLLDENMNPKIADFGMARIFQHDISEAVTKRVVGTYGYMAPEYVMHGTFSIKSDVFSFGVLILEIVSGEKNSSFHNLLRNAWEMWKREATLEFMDEALSESIDANQLLRAIHIGLLCVQEHANDRPTVSEVISMLNNENVDLPVPKKPVFFQKPYEVQPSRSTEHSSSNNIQGSVNDLTITIMQAR